MVVKITGFSESDIHRVTNKVERSLHMPLSNWIQLGVWETGSPPVGPWWNPDEELWTKVTRAPEDPGIFTLTQITLFFNQNFSQLNGNLGCYCCSESSVGKCCIFLASWKASQELNAKPYFCSLFAQKTIERKFISIK